MRAPDRCKPHAAIATAFRPRLPSCSPNIRSLSDDAWSVSADVARDERFLAEIHPLTWHMPCPDLAQMPYSSRATRVALGVFIVVSWASIGSTQTVDPDPQAQPS